MYWIRLHSFDVVRLGHRHLNFSNRQHCDCKINRNTLNLRVYGYYVPLPARHTDHDHMFFFCMPLSHSVAVLRWRPTCAVVSIDTANVMYARGMDFTLGSQRFCSFTVAHSSHTQTKKCSHTDTEAARSPDLHIVLPLKLMKREKERKKNRWAVFVFTFATARRCRTVVNTRKYYSWKNSVTGRRRLEEEKNHRSTNMYIITNQDFADQFQLVHSDDCVVERTSLRNIKTYKIYQSGLDGIS